MDFITIFTPTFNRAHTLKRLYYSLLNQTCEKFEWIIVDDGSIDGTEQIVNDWINEKKINIRYYYQENSGKHIAQNFGVEKAEGQLFTCIDSDDWLYEDAVEKILELNSTIQGKNYISGILGIDTYENGVVIGDAFPENVKFSSWTELVFKYKLKGDRMIVFRTDILKKFPFPNSGDKHMPPSYQLFLISKNYKFLITNEKFKFVEYLPDGITNNIKAKYRLAPNNYALYRLLMMDISPKGLAKFKQAIHFNSSLIYSGKKINDYEIPKNTKKYIRLTKPFGYMLNYYIEHSLRKKRY